MDPSSAQLGVGEVHRGAASLCSDLCSSFGSQEPADLKKQFPELAGDFHVPPFFEPDQFFSSVFRISSPGLQLWTHYDVSRTSPADSHQHYRFSSGELGTEHSVRNLSRSN